MNSYLGRGLGLLLLSLALITLSACNSTPKRPPPPPKPVMSSEPPPPPTAQTVVEESDRDIRDTYAPPTDNAAEVEFEEISVDGTPVTSPDDNSGHTIARSGGSGGGADDALKGGVDNRPPPGGGGAVLTAADQSGLVGPAMELGAQTDEERLASLDDELAQQLNAFDERMRRARAAAEQERVELARQHDGQPTGAADGRGYRTKESHAARGAGGAAAAGTGLGNTPDQSGAERAASGQVAVYAPPSGVADGADDDIVARQLREAASKESDPVLREKLWDEYRKYKAGL